jgi:hypothetical protein
MISKYFTNVIDNRLDRLANLLLLNSSFIRNIGLLNGKMGIAIFFFQYSKYSHNAIYEKYAEELIDEIYNNIRKVTSLDFATGLTGIGWGIEYLSKNKFLEADTDEVLNEVDIIIYRCKMQVPVLLENSDSLFGYGLYNLARLDNNMTESLSLKNVIKKQNLIFLVDECEKLLIHKRYLDFNTSYISYTTMISFCYFLLEMFKLELSPVKIDELLRYLPSYFKFSQQMSTEPYQELTLIQMIKNIIPCINDIKLKQEYLLITKDLTEKVQSVELSIESIINIYIRSAWEHLIYAPYFMINKDFLIIDQNAQNIIANEEYWIRMIDNLNLNNLSLSGFAGLGLRLMNKKAFKLIKASVKPGSDGFTF